MSGAFSFCKNCLHETGARVKVDGAWYCLACGYERGEKNALRADRDRLAAEVERLQAKCAVMRMALRGITNICDDGIYHAFESYHDAGDACEVCAALSTSAGQRALALIEAGRRLAEAVERDREARMSYHAGHDDIESVSIAKGALNTALAAYRAAEAVGGER